MLLEQLFLYKFFLLGAYPFLGPLGEQAFVGAFFSCIIDISGLPITLATSLGYMKRKKNLGNSLLCCFFLDPKVPAILSSPQLSVILHFVLCIMSRVFSLS